MSKRTAGFTLVEVFFLVPKLLLGNGIALKAPLFFDFERNGRFGQLPEEKQSFQSIYVPKQELGNESASPRRRRGSRNE